MRSSGRQRDGEKEKGRLLGPWLLFYPRLRSTARKVLKTSRARSQARGFRNYRPASDGQQGRLLMLLLTSSFAPLESAAPGEQRARLLFSLFPRPPRNCAGLKTAFICSVAAFVRRVHYLVSILIPHTTLRSPVPQSASLSFIHLLADVCTHKRIRVFLRN